MAKSKFNHAQITGISFIVPDNHVCNIDDYIHLFDNNTKKLSREKKMAGYGTRYYSPNNITAVDACEVAANDLIKNMNIVINTIDALILVTQVPDYRAPSSANVLHGRLNLPQSCAVFDVNQGCSGYVYGLWLASSLIESGACKKVLLLGSDNKTIENRTPEQVHNKETLIFSSGAAATLIEYTEKENPSYYILGSDGSRFETIISPFGRSRIPYTHELLDLMVEGKDGIKHKFAGEFMDGAEVFSFSINTVPNHVHELLEYSNSSMDNIDFFAIHQANKQIVESVAGAVNIPENKYSSNTFVNYGNMAGISCLSNLIDNAYNETYGFGRGGELHKVALISFGIGLSWASAVLNIGDIYCSGIKFHTYKSTITHEELVNYWVAKINNTMK